jgi:hypothetical protein
MLTISPLCRPACFDTNNPDLEKSISLETDVVGVRKQNVNNTTYCYERAEVLCSQGDPHSQRAVIKEIHTHRGL